MSNIISEVVPRRKTNYTSVGVPSAIIGDVHGCWHTLEKMLTILDDFFGPDKLLVSVGDLHDKGGVPHWAVSNPEDVGSAKVLRWAVQMHEERKLIVVDSNHGRALARKIGKLSSNSKPELNRTFKELTMQPDADLLVPKVEKLLKHAPSFALFSGKHTEKIAVAHAALSQRIFYKKALSPQEERFCIHTRDFRWLGEETAVVGHVRVNTPQRIKSILPSGVPGGDLLKIDTGCGEENGYLTAYIPLADEFLSVQMDERDIFENYKNQK